MKRLFIPLAFALTACDISPPPQPQTEAPPPSPVFEAQIQAVEKARAVEAQATETAEAQKKRIDEATR